MASGGHSSPRCVGLSLLRPLLLQSTGSRRAGSVIVAHGPSCSTACGIFPDQGSNPRPLHRQADSQPLHHQGSPSRRILNHCTTREVPHLDILFPLFLLPSLPLSHKPLVQFLAQRALNKLFLNEKHLPPPNYSNIFLNNEFYLFIILIVLLSMLMCFYFIPLYSSLVNPLCLKCE